MSEADRSEKRRLHVSARAVVDAAPAWSHILSTSSAGSCDRDGCGLLGPACARHITVCVDSRSGAGVDLLTAGM